MNKYYIGTRLRGFSKKFLTERKKLISLEEEYLPHITFVRPFFTKKEEDVLQKFKETCENFREPMKFRLENWGIFDVMKKEEKIVYAGVNSNKSLDLFVDSLEKNLTQLILYESKKISDERVLHATLSVEKDSRIIESILKEEFFSIDQYLLRTFISKNKKIITEYDFFLQRILNEEESADKNLFKKTIETFKEKTGLTPSKNGFISKN
ncbi:MAG: 2'-5' RNA ligase family protein [Nanoarchaeota archaeon]|nr:2'-5' RNA ligase family protein [Nanoarchaeota archaeon]